MKAWNANSVSYEIYPQGNVGSVLENQILFAMLAVVSFSIAGTFAWMGMWLILPFAGVEMLVLGIALYICQRYKKYKEVITIDHKEISIVAGYGKKNNECVLRRAWAKVLLLPTTYKDNPTLWIRSHGKQVEVGSCLRLEEKKALVQVLTQNLNRGIDIKQC